MIIEFVGLPGSGKTTLVKKVSQKLKIPLKYDLIAGGDFFPANNRLQFLLKFHKFFGNSARLYDAWAYYHVTKNTEIQKNISHLELGLINFFHGENIDQFLDLPAIRQSLERDVVVSCLANMKKTSFINDDGVLQRLVSLCGFRANKISEEKKDNFTRNFLRTIPENLLVVSLDINPKESLDRCSSRRNGIPFLLQGMKEEDYVDVCNKASFYIKNLESILLERNVPILNLSGLDGVEINVNKIIDFIQNEEKI